jgi:hypothetical protein
VWTLLDHGSAAPFLLWNETGFPPLTVSIV